MKHKKMTGFVLLLMVIFTGFSFAAKEPASILIDNFEDRNISKSPTWWTFDRIKLTVRKAKKYKIPTLGKYYLNVKGPAKNWYVGGLGMYLAKPVDNLSHVQMDVYGYGENSGKLKIELFEDDNHNTEIEQTKKYLPTKDDRFSYELNVDWKGWRQLLIPFEEFEDINPDVGNDRWDPDGKRGSGGLVHFQLIGVASSETGNIRYKLDNIKIVKYDKPEEEDEEEDD